MTFSLITARSEEGVDQVNVNLIPSAHVPSGQSQETELWDNRFENPNGLTALLTGSKEITAERFDIFSSKIEMLQIKWLKECQQSRLQNYKASHVVF